MDRTIRHSRPHYTLRDLLELYIDSREAEGKAPNTLRNDRTYVTRFLDEPTSPVHPDTLNSDAIIRWIATLRRSGIKPGTVAIQQRTVYAWIGWLLSRGDLDHDPRLAVKRVQVPRERQPQSVQSDMTRIRTVLKTDIRTERGNRIVSERVRNLAIVELIWATALRPSEVCALDFEQVDMRRGLVYVRGDQTKRKRARTLPFDPTAKVALREWLMHRGDQGGPLFTVVDGGRITYNAMRLMLRRIAARAGVEMTAYTLRRGGIGNWRRRGIDMADAMTMAGHTSPVMTGLYSGDAEADAAISAYRERIG